MSKSTSCSSEPPLPRRGGLRVPYLQKKATISSLLKCFGVSVAVLGACRFRLPLSNCWRRGCPVKSSLLPFPSSPSPIPHLSRPPRHRPGARFPNSQAEHPCHLEPSVFRIFPSLPSAMPSPQHHGDRDIRRRPWGHQQMDEEQAPHEPSTIAQDTDPHTPACSTQEVAAAAKKGPST